MPKKKAGPSPQLNFVLEGRALQAARAQLEDEAKKRSEALKQLLRSHVRRAAVFNLQEVRDKKGDLQHNLQQGGEASLIGLELTKLPRHRLKIQEGVGIGVDGKARLKMYSYQFYRDDGTTRIFRFEYHPAVGQPGASSSKHHLHVEQLSPPDTEIARIHFPVAEFLDEPVAPEKVLPRVIEWSYQELK